MNNALKRTGMLTFLAVGLTLFNPATQAFAQANTQDVTEHQQMNQQLEKAQQARLSGDYDLALQHTQQAASWMSALSQSLAEETHTLSWDTVRAGEQRLISSYFETGRLYHMAGQYTQAYNTLNAAVALDPLRRDVRTLQMMSYIALNAPAEQLALSPQPADKL
ncbi:MAG: hypothetical protein ACO1RX_16365 [Candidatus Sericytochromatia bacterium]